MILQATLIMGIILGTFCLLAAIHNYVRYQTFGFGGVVLVAFGAMLLGLSIWQSVELKIDSKGNVTAKYTQDLGAEAAERNNQFEDLRLKIAQNFEDIKRLKTVTTDAALTPTEEEDRRKAWEKFESNSEYSVLIFNRPEQDNVADKLSRSLVWEGFKASATPSDLKESQRQLNSNEAWVIYTKHGENVLQSLKKLLPHVTPDIRYVYKPNPVQLRRGDVQILLF